MYLLQHCLVFLEILHFGSSFSPINYPPSEPHTIITQNVPDQKFQILPYGKDTANNPLQRAVQDSSIPANLLLKAQFGHNITTNVIPGQDWTIPFMVENLGPSRTLILSATDTLNFVQSLDPASVTLNIGDNVTGTVHLSVPSTFEPGTISVLRLIAQPEEMVSSINFLRMVVSVVSPTPDTSPPHCDIINVNINATCKGIKLSSCSNTNWSAELVVWDHGSGIYRLDGFFSGGEVSWDFPYFPSGSVDTNHTIHLSGSCCTDKVIVTVVDGGGLNDQCVIIRAALDDHHGLAPIAIGGIVLACIVILTTVAIFIVGARRYRPNTVSNTGGGDVPISTISHSTVNIETSRV